MRNSLVIARTCSNLFTPNNVTMDTPDLSQISAEVIDLGLLIDLLTGTKEAPEVNANWFADPEGGLKEGFNWPHLQPVAESFLGGATNPADDEEGSNFNENWYPLKVQDDEGEEKESGFYIVQKSVTEEDGTSEQAEALIGIGLHKTFSFDEGKTTIDPFAFFPVIVMPDAAERNSPRLSIDKNGPVEIGFKFAYGSAFSDKIPYKKVIFAASFKFDRPQPQIIFKPCTEAGEAIEGNFSIREVIDAILAIGDVEAFLAKKIIADSELIAFTWADLFQTLGWITSSVKPFKTGDINIPVLPDGKQVLKYITDLLAKAFNKFMGGSRAIDLIKHEGKKGEPSWRMSLLMDAGRYGLNVQVVDVTVGKGATTAKLQFGNLTADKTDWVKASGGGTMPVNKGFNFFLLNNKEGSIRFDPQFEAISVGLDISKVDGQPLFNVNGYALKQAQLRGYFSTLNNNSWGAAVALNKVALPLGPTTKGAGVAQTLLASGGQKKDEGDKKPTVNPEFSLLAAYRKEFYLQLFDKDGKASDMVAIPLQKAFGPVALKDVGIGWKNPARKLFFQLNGGLNLNALKLDLDKLTVGITVTDPSNISKYSLGLDGFGLSFKSGAVSMAGGFLKDDKDVEHAQYNGAVAIQAAKWGITALGSFGNVEGSPSLFIFGVLNAALGGPPVFFVTAAAAGFGYNRKIVMPAITQVQNFPFVKAAVQPDLFKGKPTDAVLKSMSQSVPPELGQYWFAAGVKFTSFEILNSFALLMLQFGKKFEINILGLSTLQLPKPNIDKTKPYVNAQMALKATYDVDEGFLAVQAQLADNSYVIDPKCKITGGFAYNSWFTGAHSGDFVVTLGGYNKDFDKAKYPHYPDVPRLAFNWHVSESIKFSGDAYFALTPSCVMAGGTLSLTYEEGDLKAWFKAIADFLIAWQPFHYDIGIDITVGVSYHIEVLFISKTITAELGVKVQIWGPDFGGEAEVSLYIISFKIGFGEPGRSKIKSIDWEQFHNYFLSGDNSKKLHEFADSESNEVRKFITINAGAGLKSKFKSGQTEYWIVNPGEFSFNTESKFPVASLEFESGPGGDTDKPNGHEGKGFGIRPMGNIILGKGDSDLTVGVTKSNNGVDEKYSLKDWKIDVINRNEPDAMYGTVQDPKEQPEAKLVEDVMKGVACAAPARSSAGPAAFPAANILYSKLANKAYGLSSTAKLTEVTLVSERSLDRIKDTLNNDTVKQKRAEIFGALQDLGSVVSANNDMAKMAEQPENIFQGSPLLANENIQPQNCRVREKFNAAPRVSLRRKAVAAQGHQLKATIVKYGLGKLVRGGVVLRGGVFNTSSSKLVYKDGASKIIGLTPGTLQVWSLDGHSGGEVLRYSGGHPVRIVLFDKDLRVIRDEVLSGTSTEYPIPANVTEMCLQALDESNNNRTYGWHAGADLALLNVKYLLGHGCLICPKNSYRVGYKQYSYDTGLVNGRSLVLHNSKQDQNDPGGWIETRFATNVKYVKVLATKGAERIDGEPVFNLETRLIYTDDNGRKQAIDLQPNNLGVSGNELWASFALPEAVSGRHFSIWVATEGEIGTRLAGVVASAEAFDGWTEALRHNLLKSTGGATALNTSGKSSVGFTNTLNF